MKNIFVILFIFLLVPVFAFDANEYGSFETRSVIMNKLRGQDRITQEQKDILLSKKLTPTHKCLFEQIKKGNIENVKLLLEAHVNPNQSYLSEYAIYIASKENQFEILKLLYENNAKLDKGFYSELYEAVRNKNQEMAQYLLDRGSKVNYTDALTTNTILYMSLKNKMYDISKQLIAKGAKADLRSVKYIKKHKLLDLIPENQQ